MQRVHVECCEYLVAWRGQEPARSENDAPEGVTVETVLRFGAVGNVQTGTVPTDLTECVAATRIVDFQPGVNRRTEVNLSQPPSRDLIKSAKLLPQSYRHACTHWQRVL